MMILRSSPASPFGRKVRIAIALLGFDKDVKVEPADTGDVNDSVRLQNPLGKIPTLILEDGRALYDSRVIVEYLDALAGGGKIIPVGPARFTALHRQALADGIMDAALLQVYEQRYREPEIRSSKWVGRQADKVARALVVAERDPPAALDVGAIALACALGYLDLRFAGAWRAEHHGLVAWLDGFAATVPAFAATRHAI